MNSNQTEASKFRTYHSNPNALSSSDLYLIKEWIEKYPYCQSLHYLASRTAINTQEYENFLTQAAAIAPSRAVLHAVVYEPEQFFTELSLIIEEEETHHETVQTDQDNADNPFGIDLNQIYGSEFKVETTEPDAEALDKEAEEILLVEDDVEVEIWNPEEEQAIAGDLNLDSEIVSEDLGKQTQLEIVEEEEEFEIALKGEEQIALLQETEIVENIEAEITEEVELVEEEEIVEDKEVEPVENIEDEVSITEEIVEEKEIESVENIEDEVSITEETELVVEDEEIVEEKEIESVENIEDEVSITEEIVEEKEIESVENIEDEVSITEETELVVEEEEIVEDTEVESVENIQDEVSITEETEPVVEEEEVVEDTEVESVENIEDEVAITEETELAVEEEEIVEDTEVESVENIQDEVSITEETEPVVEEEEVVEEKEVEPVENIEDEVAITEETELAVEEEELTVSVSATEPIKKDELQFDHPIQADFFALNRKELAKIEVKQEEQSVSQYNDERMPYTFLWWLNKTRKEHSSNHQPYSSFKLDTSKQIKKADPDRLNQQIAENIFHLRGAEEISSSSANYTVPFDFRKKEFQIIEKFIKEEPQIKPPTANKIDSENKAKRSSEDANQVVSETLAKIYVEQMLYHKALDVYKKLSLKFPEKSTYFASQIKYLELKVN
ncbi:hypothetical protein [Pedobacter cryophilus]|uniref:Uncharacterized protein n=1 Tax=Pedobacter cryophilus TaxID=2571271 RepID=A0A4U1BVK0_9SPHI|nr:hypothetical protein [Pedobacter cryophilus]TKB96214.1 hypothetical protein FA046_13580 [Pedobacter cryophilus]